MVVIPKKFCICCSITGIIIYTVGWYVVESEKQMRKMIKKSHSNDQEDQDRFPDCKWSQNHWYHQPQN